MARIPAKAIARISSTRSSELAAMSWEWVLRASGQVVYQLTEVDGRRERNPWTAVTQVPEAELKALRADHDKAVSLLADLARQHGHEVVGYLA
jgi:hypothetical protein